jgi:O-6-methylguanine DNA methyltransferase
MTEGIAPGAAPEKCSAPGAALADGIAPGAVPEQRSAAGAALAEHSAPGDAMAQHSAHIETPLGAMHAVMRNGALVRLAFVDAAAAPGSGDAVRAPGHDVPTLRQEQPPAVVPGNSPSHEDPLLCALRAELDAYFAGELQAFTIPVDPQGTSFQRSVWEVLRGIPFGVTRSYGEQARIIGRPTATRAVARANGDNPIAILIPCHRVLGSGGRLTGYAGGLWRKQRLLDLEQGSLL